MAALLHIVSSRAPYHRGGLTFAFAPGKTIAAVVVPVADLSDVQLTQLLADPHLVTVMIDGGETLAGDDVVATLSLIERERTVTAREAGLAAREEIMASAAALLNSREVAISQREAAVGEREYAASAGRLPYASDARLDDTSAPIVKETTMTDGLTHDVLTESDRERAERIESDGRDRINEDAEEPVDRVGAPNTRRNPRRRAPVKIPNE